MPATSLREEKTGSAEGDRLIQMASALLAVAFDLG